LTVSDCHTHFPWAIGTGFTTRVFLLHPPCRFLFTGSPWSDRLLDWPIGRRSPVVATLPPSLGPPPFEKPRTSKSKRNSADSMSVVLSTSTTDYRPLSGVFYLQHLHPDPGGRAARFWLEEDIFHDQAREILKATSACLQMPSCFYSTHLHLLFLARRC